MAQAIVNQPTWKKWRGKVAGATAGALVGGPLGALVGAALGHTYDHYFRALQKVEKLYAEIDRPAPALRPQSAVKEAQEAAFTIGIIALGAKLAHSSQRLRPDVVDSFRTVFGLPEKHVPMIRKMFEQALFDRVGYRPYAQQLAEMFSGRPQRLEELINGLIRFAQADGVMNDDVAAYLKQVAAIFNIPETRITQMMLANGVMPAQRLARDAYTLLGVAPNAPEVLVKDAYRALIRQYHPDALQGLDGVAIAAANDRMAAINAAYSDIKKQRGWN